MMQILKIFLLVVLCVASSTSAKTLRHRGLALLGGFTEVDPNDEMALKAKQMVEFYLMEYAHTYTFFQYNCPDIEYSIVSCEKQVVQGTNYKLVIQVSTPDMGCVGLFDAMVHQNLEDGAMSVTEWGDELECDKINS
mmetsp:Transcript_39148/g.55107  ORF Transcript_39148/g.55107 Transcript_39148/m.55107 type:complete len:137 (+) Transcript_39148:42-452(+)